MAALLAIPLSLAAELAVRALRLNDVPLFDADARIGYIPRADQAGAWRWSNRWAFNELHMGTARRFTPLPGTDDVLLIGDSLVSGGVHYREEQRFGPSLERSSGRRIWPISAPSWGLQNELQYLRDHPQVPRGVDRIVLISNSGDFAKPSSWASEVSHPRHRPISAIYSLVRKLIVDSEEASKGPSPAGLKVAPRDNIADFARFARDFGKPVTIVIYPSKEEEAGQAPCAYSRPAAYGDFANVHYLCVKQDRRWSTALYKDGIHPTVTGYGVLSAIVSDALRTPPQAAPWPSARYSADRISISRLTVRSNSKAPSPAG